MQDDQTPEISPEESAEETMPETREMGDEIFERYESQAEEVATEDLTPVTAAEAPVTDAFAHNEDQAAAEAGNAVMREILFNEANFEGALQNATPNELVMLMEAIAREPDVAAVQSRAPLVKKAFEKVLAENADSVGAGLASRLNTALARFNKRRTEMRAQQEKDREENTKLKQELLDRLKAIVEEEKVTEIQAVREIQNRWKEIGWVAQDKRQAINETYKYLLDLFYNLRGKYNELRDLDRKHNLDEKLRIIREIESLIPAEADLSRDTWNTFSQKLKNLQEYWRTLGPVPRENMEEVNEKLKNALDSFYSLRSQFYHAQDEIKEENATKKNELLAKFRPFAEFTATKPKDWNLATQQVIALQEEWKKTGPAPLDVNKQLWQEYRKICDGFFENKSKFFKVFDEEREAAMAAKTALCEEAEALMNSDNFKETAERMRQMQEEWKKTGPVHERFSNKIWKRFRAACDHFFQKRKEAISGAPEEQAANLARKQELLARVQEILNEENLREFIEEVKELQAQFKGIGHVPMAEKEKISKSFRDAADEFFRKLPPRTGGSGGGGNFNRNAGGNSNSRGKGGPKGGGNFNKSRSAPRPQEETIDPNDPTRKVRQDISRLKERISTVKEKVSSYEINIQMVSKGKSGDGLRKMIQGQIDEEKTFLGKLEGDLKSLNDQLKAIVEAAKAEAAAAAAEPVTADENQQNEAPPATENPEA